MGNKHSKSLFSRYIHSPVALVLTILLAGGFIGSFFSITIIQGTGKALTAVNIADSNLDLIIDGQVVDTSTRYDPKASWIDPAGQRVSIVAYTSDCWLSTWDGKPLANNTAALATSNWTLTITNATGTIQEAVFYYVVYYTVEVCIRTGPVAVFNFPVTTHYLTPFAGTIYDGAYLHNIYGGYNYATSTPNGHASTIISWWPCYVPSQVYSDDTKGALTSLEWVGESHDSAVAPPSPKWQTNVMSSYYTGGTDHNGVCTYPNSGNSRQAKITTSIVPVSFQDVDGSNYDPSIDSSIAPDGSCTANSRVLNYMAAKPTTATVNIHVKANSQTVKGYNVSYPMTLRNGTIVNVAVNTTSAVVGFSGADMAFGHNGTRASVSLSGPVPNHNPASQIPTFDLSNPTEAQLKSYSDNAVTTTQSGTSGTNVPGTVTLNGGIDVKSAKIWPVQSASSTTNAITATNSVIKSINLTNIAGNCGIPTTLNISDTTTLQPHVDVGDAYATVTWERGAENAQAYSIIPGQTSSVDFQNSWHKTSYTKDISWVYGANQTNIYWLRNYTFPVDVVSERQAQAFNSDGTPILLSDIFDTANNSFYYNPKADELNVTQESIDLNDPCTHPVALFDTASWGFGIQCWWNKSWWIFAAVGAFAIAIIAIDIYARIHGHYKGGK